MESAPSVHLTFKAPSSHVEAQFWEQLYRLKLNEYKLDKSSKNIKAYVSIRGFPTDIHFTVMSFQPDDSEDQFYDLSLPSMLINTDSIEEFKNYDKKGLLESEGVAILDYIESGQRFDIKQVLRTTLLTYADLKTYKFTYWFCFPALVPSVPLTVLPLPWSRTSSIATMSDLNSVLNVKTMYSRIYQHFYDLRHNLAISNRQLLEAMFCFQIIVLDDGSIVIDSMENYNTERNTCISHRFVALMENVSDISTPKEGECQLPWYARNVFAWLSRQSKTNDANFVDVIILKSSLIPLMFHNICQLHTSTNESNMSQLDVERISSYEELSIVFRLDLASTNYPRDKDNKPRVVGWELNERLRPGPRVMDVSHSLSPLLLSQQAIALNISLMQWRLWPSLRRLQVAKTRCLIFGGGTLGGYLCRSLLAWGCDSITVVDQGHVELSNPVRQPLFTYDDAVHNRFKALAAVGGMRKIFPGVQARGIVRSIPMPGHSYDPSAKLDTRDVDEYNHSHSETQINIDDISRNNIQEILNTVTASSSHVVSSDPLEEAITALDQLVQEHDVVFNVTDSREARWLPTVMAASRNKMLINVALGFDSFLVLRHGMQQDVGCYFCQDVVAATNSQRQVPLDMRCTVTRPGTSLVASGLAVELLVSLLHCDDLSGPKANNNISDDSANHAQFSNDSLPHMIRGSISGFSQYLPRTPPFKCCTACSPPIVEAYKSNASEFVRMALERPEALEQISGISDMTKDIQDLDVSWDSDDQDS